MSAKPPIKPRVYGHPSPKKKPWFERNLKTLFIISIALFLIQSMRGCIISSSLTRGEKNIIAERDSVYRVKDRKIGELERVFQESQDENQRLLYELKIAGVKIDAAKERADAIQETAQKIKQNTTITFDTEKDKTN